MSEANTPQPVLIYPQNPIQNDDEINLFELWQGLVKQKNTIFSITAIVTLIAILYAFLATPIYKAETVFLPPSASDIQALKVENISDITIDLVYSQFRENLSSIAIRQQLFDKMKLADQFQPERDDAENVNEIFQEFNENISLAIPASKKGEPPLATTTLSIEGNDPALTASIVNRLTIAAEQATKTGLIFDIEAKIKEQIKTLNLEIKLLLDITKKQRLDQIERLETSDSLKRNEIEDKIKVLRDSAQDKRLDRIAKLTEANTIAHSLGIKDPIDFKLKKISDSSTKKYQIMTDISNKSSQLYTLGYEALEAEIDSLKKRTNDDPYIKELRSLEEQLKLLEHNRKAEQLKNRTNDAPFITELREKENSIAYLEAIKIAPESIKVAHLDQAAFPPEKKIKPKRKLIVIIGAILGFILSLFIVLILNIKQKYSLEKS